MYVCVCVCREREREREREFFFKIPLYDVLHVNRATIVASISWEVEEVRAALIV